MTTRTGHPAAEWELWSTTARVVVAGGAAALRTARVAVRDVVDEMDAAASRFRDDSELTRVNAAGGGVVEVSELFAATLDAALTAAARTDGAVDPTLGRHLVALGYATDFALASTFRPAPMQPLAKAGRWREIQLDLATRRVSLPDGLHLDLGAIAKARAADVAAERASAATGAAVLVSLGGDVAVSGPPPGEDGWVVRVAEAPGDAGPLVVVADGGVATSTTTLRRWHHGNRSYHHVIDPATGRPVDGRWRTATVAAASCVEANAASTAALVLADRAVDWLETQRLPSRLVAVDGSVACLAGWPEDGVLE
jgi:thiamine biosynthesis lipoprotein